MPNLISSSICLSSFWFMVETLAYPYLVQNRLRKVCLFNYTILRNIAPYIRYALPFLQHCIIHAIKSCTASLYGIRCPVQARLCYWRLCKMSLQANILRYGILIQSISAPRKPEYASQTNSKTLTVREPGKVRQFNQTQHNVNYAARF